MSSAAGSPQPQRLRVVDVEPRASPVTCVARAAATTTTSLAGGDAIRSRVDRDADAARARSASVALAPGDVLGLGRRALRGRQRLVERVDAARAAPRNSKRRKISFNSERSGGCSTSSAGSTPRSRSRRIVARSFEARACSAFSAIAFAARGRELGACSTTSSSEPYCEISWPGGLVPDPGDARDVVARVALQPDEVRDLVGADPVARLDPLGRVHLHVRDAARRHHQADVLGDELERVAVGRDDARLHARLVGLRRERRDHVVRLPALELEVPVPEGLDDRTEVRELLAEEVRHRAAVGLVLGVDLLAVDGSRVPRDRDAARLVVGEELEEHVREAEERVRRLAVGRLQLLGQREEGAVREVVAVDEEELRIARGRVVELTSSSPVSVFGTRSSLCGAHRCGRRSARARPSTRRPQVPPDVCTPG